MLILYKQEDFAERVKQISRGELCDVVYDGVGKDTFAGSLKSLRPRGLFVSFGNASGPVPPFSIAELNNHGSLFATRPTLFTYAAKREDMTAMAAEMFDLVQDGKIVSEPRHDAVERSLRRERADVELV